MRNASNGDENLPKQFELACEIGQLVTVWEKDLKSLQPGEYDVVSEWQHIEVEGEEVVYQVQLRLRRVS